VRRPADREMDGLRVLARAVREGVCDTLMANPDTPWRKTQRRRVEAALAWIETELPPKDSAK
jgi:hypothetical protein